MTAHPLPVPPRAPQKPHSIAQHGQTRVDPYFWLRERESAEVLDYLNAENAYTAAVLAPTAALQETLFQEMKGRMMEDDISVPEYYGDRRYAYLTRKEAGKQYDIHYRRAADGAEQVLIDENALAAGHTYFRIATFAPSRDHRYIAYSTDFDGDEVYTLRFLDLHTGTVLEDEIPNTYYGLEWAADNAMVFYTTLDATKRPSRVFRHRLGTPASDDVLVYEERDEVFAVWLGTTSSRRHIAITLAAFGCTEIRLIPADAPETPPVTVASRRKDVEYQIDDDGRHYYLVTNADGAQNFKLWVTDAIAGDATAWRELLPHRPQTHLESVQLFAGHMLRFEREGGLSRVRVSDHACTWTRDIGFDEPAYALSAAGNGVFDTDMVRLNYSSLTTPKQVIEIDVHTGVRTVLKEQRIPSGYDASRWRSERIWATAPDGVQVPISLVAPAGMQRDGRNPMLLVGYGSYGINYEPGFDYRLLSLLERGYGVAIAHVRGGSEMGRSWYDDGKLLNKKNTFNDFVACAQHLIAEGYTAPERLAIRGGSAGGLLMGAVLNTAPELFKAVISDVPFVDVINTMSDTSIPLTVMEFEQWGNPAQREYFDYMLSYSPYDNLQPGAYPHLLVTAGLNDPRVQYWEPAKYVAKLRTLKTDDTVLLLRTNMSAGHGGASGRYDFLREDALRYAFVITYCGG
jgi:oligopeptidase B